MKFVKDISLTPICVFIAVYGVFGGFLICQLLLSFSTFHALLECGICAAVSVGLSALTIWFCQRNHSK